MHQRKRVVELQQVRAEVEGHVADDSLADGREVAPPRAVEIEQGNGGGDVVFEDRLEHPFGEGGAGFQIVPVPHGPDLARVAIGAGASPLVALEIDVEGREGLRICLLYTS